MAAAEPYVRFFSLCSYPSIFPAPVTYNRMPDGSSDSGCLVDDQTKVDGQAFYTYLVGTKSQRAHIDWIPGVTIVAL